MILMFLYYTFLYKLYKCHYHYCVCTPTHYSYSGVIAHTNTLFVFRCNCSCYHFVFNTTYVCKSSSCTNSTNQPVAALSYQVHVKWLDNTLGWQCVITYTLQYQQQNYTTLAYWIVQHLFYLSCYQVMGTQ